MNAREYYENALAERGYKPDEAQLRAIDRLQKYYDDWVRFKAMRSNALKKLLNRPDVPRGVYLWGGVGRGKSFLMDAFYAPCRWSARRACTSMSSCAAFTASSRTSRACRTRSMKSRGGWPGAIASSASMSSTSPMWPMR